MYSKTNYFIMKQLQYSIFLLFAIATTTFAQEYQLSLSDKSCPNGCGVLSNYNEGDETTIIVSIVTKDISLVEETVAKVKYELPEGLTLSDLGLSAENFVIKIGENHPTTVEIPVKFPSNNTQEGKRKLRFFLEEENMIDGVNSVEYEICDVYTDISVNFESAKNTIEEGNPITLFINVSSDDYGGVGKIKLVSEDYGDTAKEFQFDLNEKTTRCPDPYDTKVIIETKDDQLFKGDRFLRFRLELPKGFSSDRETTQVLIKENDEPSGKIKFLKRPANSCNISRLIECDSENVNNGYIKLIDIPQFNGVEFFLKNRDNIISRKVVQNGELLFDKLENTIYRIELGGKGFNIDLDNN